MGESYNGIAAENIRIHCRAGNWEQSIKVAAEPLLSDNSIGEIYVKRMIEAVHEYGPYIVLAPGLALAHAQPDASVKRNNMSLATFDDGVAFHCANDPVYVVMCLASIDPSSHTRQLQIVARWLLEEEDAIGRMRACEDGREVSNLFRK